MGLHVTPPPPHSTFLHAKSVAIVTTHYAQMLWLLDCVWCVETWLHGDHGYECVQTIAPLDRYQGLQAPIVLASMPSQAAGIMKVWCGRTH